MLITKASARQASTRRPSRLRPIRRGIGGVVVVGSGWSMAAASLPAGRDHGYGVTVLARCKSARAVYPSGNCRSVGARQPRDAVELDAFLVQRFGFAVA